MVKDIVYHYLNQDELRPVLVKDFWSMLGQKPIRTNVREHFLNMHSDEQVYAISTKDIFPQEGDFKFNKNIEKMTIAQFFEGDGTNVQDNIPREFIASTSTLKDICDVQLEQRYLKHGYARFFISRKNHRTDLHFDWSPEQNFFVNIGGRKRVLLAHPLDITERSLGNVCPNSNFHKFSEYILEPGDLLIMPAFYWHDVESLEDSCSISFRVFPEEKYKKLCVDFIADNRLHPFLYDENKLQMLRKAQIDIKSIRSGSAYASYVKELTGDSTTLPKYDDYLAARFEHERHPKFVSSRMRFKKILGDKGWLV